MPNFKEIAKHTAVILTVIFVAVLSLSLTGFLPAFFNLTYLFFFVVAVNVWFLALKIKSMPEKERENSKLTYFCSHLFIVLLVIIALNQFAKIEQVTALLPELTALAIGSGFLTFYSNRERVETELENEKAQEEKAEEKRKQEFSAKFPTIAKIPVLRSIVKWMYKEGWWYSLALIGIILIGAYFYFNGLGNYGFQGDEYYHAKVAKTYFESGKLFSLGDEPYTRSQLTSLLPIISKYFFDYLNIRVSDEFIFRFPIVLLSLTIILLVYLISKLYINKKYSLLITLLYTTEVWFIYFAKYLRFYAPSLALITLLLYLNLKYLFNKKIIYYSLFLALLGYFFLTNYFLLLITFLFLLLLKIFYSEQKYKRAVFLIFLGLGSVLFEYFKILTYTASKYNSAIISWNYSNIVKQFLWFSINYPIFFILFLSGIFLISKKSRYLFLYSMGNFLFFIFYVNNAEFNFSFRPIYFFLIFIFILSIITSKYLIRNKKLLLVIFVILILINIYQSFVYNINEPGDKYYPTKLIYEKMEIVVGSKDISVFIENYSKNPNIQYPGIVTIGLESLDEYTNIEVLNAFSYSRGNGDSDNINELKTLFENNSGRDIFIVVYPSAYANRINYLYYYLWDGRQYVTEVSPSFAEYIGNSNDFEQVYTSNDGYSKIYLKKH